MNMFSSVVATITILVGPVAAFAQQDFKAPPSKKPDAKILKAIETKSDRLDRALQSLQRKGVSDLWLAQAAIGIQAADRIVGNDEFFQDSYVNWTLEALDMALLRAKLMESGEFAWASTPGFSTIRAYRSAIDGSLQPYAVTLPAAYGREPRKWRIDVVLHGRGKNLNEVSFIHQHHDKPAAKDQDFIQIAIYGRGNNAYRWAGEVDVSEAIDHFVAVERVLNRGHLLDPNRVVLRGFSMGGAGTWHLGLHRPDRWCCLGPGAGFTTTHGYIKNLPDQLPAYQESCLRIYDAVDYAENAFNVPIVAYSGAKDPQKKAADNIEARLKKLGIAMTHIIAPDLEHKFPAEWQKKAEAFYGKHAAAGKPDYPDRVKFVTYTMKYPSCQWVEILGLERHYEKTVVDAECTEAEFIVKTANVRGLRLQMKIGKTAETTVKIDGDTLTCKPQLVASGTYQIYLQRRGGRWTSSLYQRVLVDRQQHPQKTMGLQGPLDDAFTSAFLCVRGTGKPWHDATHKYAEANLERFKAEWAKYWRGDLPVKDDTEITNADYATKNLILFGDPSSNSIIANVLDGLPLQWTKETITLHDKSYAAKDHVPVMIYPSPLQPDRYIVLNSGHTFRKADYEGTNALLYPRLGDFAMLRLAGGERNPLQVDVATAGLFDEFWKLPK
jgi:dienelactone hydrolase